jgi:hypothetical protein
LPSTASFAAAILLSEVTGANCRAYAAGRGSNGGARRDLQDLAAAISSCTRRRSKTANRPTSGRCAIWRALSCSGFTPARDPVRS